MLRTADDFQWSAMAICESYADKHGFRNKKGILDVHRAANQLLRDQLNGKTLLYFWPPTHTNDANQTTPTQSARAVAGMK
jgi:ribosome biogenesis GTPase A